AVPDAQEGVERLLHLVVLRLHRQVLHVVLQHLAQQRHVAGVAEAKVVVALGVERHIPQQQRASTHPRQRQRQPLPPRSLPTPPPPPPPRPPPPPSPPLPPLLPLFPPPPLHPLPPNAAAHHPQQPHPQQQHRHKQLGRPHHHRPAHQPPQQQPPSQALGPAHE